MLYSRFVTSDSILFPSQCRYSMLRCSPVMREPYTTFARPLSIGASSFGQSSGSYSRSASWMSTRSPVTCSSPVRIAAPFPRFCGWVTIFTVLSPSWVSTGVGAVVAAVVDDDELAVERQLDRAHPAQDLDHRVALVVHGHDHRELRYGHRVVLSATPDVTDRAPCGTTRTCGSVPREAGPSAPIRAPSRASVMSGWRWVGSSTGSGSNAISDDDPVTSSTASRELEDRELVRVPDVHRTDVVRLEQAEDPARSGRRRSRTNGSAGPRRRPSSGLPSIAWTRKFDTTRPSAGRSRGP